MKLSAHQLKSLKYKIITKNEEIVNEHGNVQEEKKPTEQGRYSNLTSITTKV